MHFTYLTNRSMRPTSQMRATFPSMRTSLATLCSSPNLCSATLRGHIASSPYYLQVRNPHFCRSSLTRINISKTSARIRLLLFDKLVHIAQFSGLSFNAVVPFVDVSPRLTLSISHATSYFRKLNLKSKLSCPNYIYRSSPFIKLTLLSTSILCSIAMFQFVTILSLLAFSFTQGQAMPLAASPLLNVVMEARLNSSVHVPVTTTMVPSL